MAVLLWGDGIPTNKKEQDDLILDVGCLFI
jgi:hypothetical protein